MPAIEPPADHESLRDRVRNAVFWSSGSQIVAQMITWMTTFLVIRLLTPADYGLVAMAALVVGFLSLLEGFGFASSLVQRETIRKMHIRQVFGLLILLNLGLAAAQFLAAPMAAAYFREPQLVAILRVQALLFLTTPFLALPFALLSRELKFKKMAIAALVGSIAGAATALTLAMLGYGVWTLVYAPIVMFSVRAACLTIAAKSLVWPSFTFKGAGAMIGFGGAMTVTQFFWFLQSQSDVFIAGRVFDAHMLGIYTTALFLTQMLVSKFIPPLNDVAFSAYSRMNREGTLIAPAFANSVRLILIAVLPFYVGLAITAEPFVQSILGEQWLAIIPLVQLLAVAMPFMTLQILFAPATNALGRPGIALRVNIMGALIMATAFFVGVQYGVIGMARVWLIGFPTITAVTMLVSMPVIGINLTALARAIAPGLVASLAMGFIVVAIDSQLPSLPALTRLALLALAGMASYAMLLLAFARPMVIELWRLIARRNPVAA